MPVQIKGASAFDKLPARVQKSIMQPLLSTARRVQSDAARHGPAFSKDISVQTRKTNKTAAGVEIVVNSPGAMFAEFGTHKERPQPFLRPAFEQNKDAARKLIADAVRGACEEGDNE